MMFENLELVLEEAGYGLADLVSTRLYLVDYANFETVNAAYRRWLKPPFPARTTLQAAALPLAARVQIDATFDAAGAIDAQGMGDCRSWDEITNKSAIPVLRKGSSR